MRIINFSKANCKNCYKCLRTCPVKAIRFDAHQAEIDEQRCIACGQCFVVCPQNARYIKSDLAFVQHALKEGKKVIVSLAPSFAGFFEEPNEFIQALKSLGFYSIEETAIGAQAITSAYAQYIEENNPKYGITSCCPTINFYIEKYYPSLIPYLLPFVSPMKAHGKFIKKELEDALTVFMGPCISKKHESMMDRTCDIDAVLTLEEVTHWLETSNITSSSSIRTPDKAHPNTNGREYPITGGIAKGLEPLLIENEYDILSITGLDSSKKIFEALKNKTLNKCFVEISACNESCLGGPAVPKNSPSIYKRKQNIKQFITGSKEIESNNALTPFETRALSYNFTNQSLPTNPISEEQLQSILKQLGKHQLSDELNCGACGYDTCRDKAIAVYEKMSQPDMCIPYMRSKAESMSDVIFLSSPNAIFIIDEQLKIINANPAAKSIFNLKEESYYSNYIYNFIDVINWETIYKSKEEIINKKVQLNPYDLDVILNVLYLPKENILLAILTNITQEEQRKKELAQMKENTLDITQKVIDKQMRVAQEIASLLGETTAETKVALNKLKKVVSGEEGDF
ncbi:iron only hydrogenase large subunit-like protein [Natranaerovirga hydrolytica]|uniref:Iron only hydrogenase large subunit-like protein n=1 Tax=Natranaerovirga hydrolytica TaxID=680378 RepID=A0A4R1N7J1_9FIRM|nr:[Fe-Fe] hydrogenase large subunit C-terminal domain-containing protein [Natranaerovirga hydrolytica]TCK98633.1 iron only hydrogenase large subunit-like protein [Natranaerovirga hydrolytica]